MKRIIILLGPTGVGKTGASILLAQALGTEIISADSMQIYRGMDIGTAKPSRDERSGVTHHMIDIVDPTESYSAGQYIRAITPIIEDLHLRGKVPLMVGGTGLYIKAVTRGIFAGPSADWDLREELLSAEEAQKGYLYTYLLKTDPEAAGRIERNDTRRIVRALEVCLRGKDRISVLQEKLTKPLPYDFIKIGITRERRELYRMIEFRIERMLSEGLIEEVKALVGKKPDKTPLQAIGYKEIASYLRGEITADEAVKLIKRNTRRYAKRQFTWFKKEEGINWIDVTGVYKSVDVFRKIMNALE
jgi:tRNA dimethylallyltransferase